MLCDSSGRAVRRVSRVPPSRFGKDRDLQVASTDVETKPFSIQNKAIKPYLGLGSAPATGAVFRALAENPGRTGSFQVSGNCSVRPVAESEGSSLGWRDLKKSKIQTPHSGYEELIQGYLTLFKAI